MDHIRPKSNRGSDHRYNIQLLCRDCNLRKGVMNWEDFLAMERERNEKRLARLANDLFA
jgi:5-methylcytosine-specific restriction endonuclease McrA